MHPKAYSNMPISAEVLNTPYYVLMDGLRRIGPKILPSQGGMECSPIYGFSDKSFYDTFRTHSHLALTPYPLVKVYLREQVDAPGDGLRLVVVDAAGPHEPCLYAATMKAVLEAQENRTTHVTAAHCLMFNQETNAYRFPASSEQDLPSHVAPLPGQPRSGTGDI